MATSTLDRIKAICSEHSITSFDPTQGFSDGKGGYTPSFFAAAKAEGRLAEVIADVATLIKAGSIAVTYRVRGADGQWAVLRHELTGEPLSGPEVRASGIRNARPRLSLMDAESVEQRRLNRLAHRAPKPDDDNIPF